MKKGISLLLCVFIIFQGVTAIASADTLLFYEDFNAYATNETQISVLDINGGKGRIVEDGAYNKSLLLSDKDAVTLQKTVENIEKSFVISGDFHCEGEAPSFRLGVLGNNPVYLISVEDGIIKSHDGKELGGVSARNVNIAICVNTYRKTYSVIVNGKMCLKDWAMSDLVSAKGISVFKLAKNNSQLYVDNLAVYNGGEVKNVFPKSGYNNEFTEYIGFEDDAGDYMYFSSNWINTYNWNYNYTNSDIKSESNSLDFAMATKEKIHDKYIRLHKGGDLGLLFDVRLNKKGTMSSEKVEKYYLVSVKAKAVNLTSPVQFFLMRDTTSTGTQQDVQIGTLLATGDLQLLDGTVIKGVAAGNQYFTCKYAIDMLNHTIDVYVNDELVKEGMKFPETFNKIYFFRCRIMDTGGVGDLYLEDYEVTGLEQPYKNGEEPMTAIFGDDAPVAEYLADKVGVQAYGETLYANGQKSKWNDRMVYQNGDAMVPREVLETAFGDMGAVDYQKNSVTYNGKEIVFDKAPIEKNGEVLYPIGEFAEKVLNKHFLDDKKGMILISDNQLRFDVDAPSEQYYIYKDYSSKTYVRSDLEELNAFLFYDRADAAELRKLFNEKTQNGTVHPRILATAEDFNRIRNTYEEDKILNEMYRYFIKLADDLIANNEPVIDYEWDTIQTYTQIYNARKFRLRMEALGFAYQMTGDKKYSERAWKEFESLATFPDFDYAHPIDTGEYQMGVAIGYDWMYDAFTEEQRKVIQETLYRNGLNVVWQSYYGRTRPESNAVQNWSAYKVVSNFNTVMNGGNIAAALAVAEVYPKVCFDVLEKAYRSLEYTMLGLAPSGAWDEGSNYWIYTIDYLSRALMTSKASLGTDFGFLKAEGLSETGNFITSIQSLNGGNAFHDSPSSTAMTYYVFPYLSAEFDQPALQALRTQAWEMGIEGERKIMEMFTYNPNVDMSALESFSNLLITEGTESFSIRESYTDPDAMYLSAHFGAVNCNHAHNDTGTFVLEMLGEKWAEDLGMESYSLNVPSAELYRKRTEGHNTFTINNTAAFNQNLSGFAPIIKSEEKERGAYVAADMSSVYDDVSNMLMGYYVGDDMKSVTMRAEMDLTKDSEIYWFMHTQAGVLINDNQAILTKNGKSVVMTFETDAPKSEISVMDARPLPESPDASGQNQNIGYRKVAIKLNGMGKMNLTVKLAPMGTAAASAPIYNVPISEWTIPDGEKVATTDEYDLGYKAIVVNGEEYTSLETYSVPYGEDVPEIEVIPNDPNAIVEVNNAETEDDVTIIKIFAPDRSRYIMYFIDFTINYSATGSFSGKTPYVIKNVEVTAEPQPANVKNNMIDNDMSTRWTVLSTGEQAVFDLGSSRELNAVAIAFWKGNVRSYKFNLRVSEDGVNYRDVLTDAESCGETEDYEIFGFDTVNARYVMFEGWGNSESANGVNSNILEFRCLKQ